MIRLYIKESYKEARDLLRPFKDDICIVKNDRDPVFVVTYENLESQVRDKCKVTKATDWTEKDKFDLIQESHELNYQFSGRPDFVNNATL